METEPQKSSPLFLRLRISLRHTLPSSMVSTEWRTDPEEGFAAFSSRGFLPMTSSADTRETPGKGGIHMLDISIDIRDDDTHGLCSPPAPAFSTRACVPRPVPLQACLGAVAQPDVEPGQRRASSAVTPSAGSPSCGRTGRRAPAPGPRRSRWQGRYPVLWTVASADDRTPR